MSEDSELGGNWIGWLLSLIVIIGTIVTGYPNWKASHDLKVAKKAAAAVEKQVAVKKSLGPKSYTLRSSDSILGIPTSRKPYTWFHSGGTIKFRWILRNGMPFRDSRNENVDAEGWIIIPAGKEERDFVSYASMPTEGQIMALEFEHPGTSDEVVMVKFTQTKL